MKLVGESFPWSPASALVHTRDNHTSMLGVRQLAAAARAAGSAAVELRAGGGGGGGGGGGWCLEPCSAAAADALQAATGAAAAAGGGVGDAVGGEPQHLFALPLESNFSGARYDPRLVEAVQSGTLRWLDRAASGGGGDGGSGGGGGSGPADDGSGSGGSGGGALRPLPRGRWRVLLDAAKGASTRPPDLAACPADFVALSFYKIFGWPTGEAEL